MTLAKLQPKSNMLFLLTIQAWHHVTSDRSHGTGSGLGALTCWAKEPRNACPARAVERRIVFLVLVEAVAEEGGRGGVVDEWERMRIGGGQGTRKGAESEVKMQNTCCCFSRSEQLEV